MVHCKQPAELILSAEDWERILRRYDLPTDRADLRVIVGYEQDGQVLLLGCRVAGAYRLIFCDTGLMVAFSHVQDEASLWACCSRMAASEGATLVV